MVARAPATTVPRDRYRLVQFLRPGLLLPALIVVAVVVLVAIAPGFATAQNLKNLSRQWAPIGVLGMGAAIVILAGGIDLSFASSMGLVSVITAEASVRSESPYALLLAIPVGLFAGLINGILVTKIRMSPIVVTLATLVFFRGIANVLAGGLPIYGLPAGYGWLGSAFIGPVPTLSLIAAIVVAFDLFLLHKTRFGLRIYGTGDNALAATISGIDPYRVLFGAYMFAGLHWGIAGALLTSRVDSGQPSLGTGFEVQVLTAVFLGGVSLIGGSGRLHNVVLASVLLATLANGLNLLGIFDFQQQIIFGCLLILATLLAHYIAARQSPSDPLVPADDTT